MVCLFFFSYCANPITASDMKKFEKKKKASASDMKKAEKRKKKKVDTFDEEKKG